MHHFIKGYPLHIEKFIGVQLLLAEFQPLGQKQVQCFPVAAGGGQELAEGQEGLRFRAGLLLQFPQSARHRVLAGVQLACGQLIQHLAKYIPVLADHQYPVGLIQGQDRCAVHMVHHFPGGFLAVGQAHVIHVHRHDFTLKYVLAAELDLRQIHGHFHSIHLV